MQDIQCIGEVAGGDRILVQEARRAGIVRPADVVVVGRTGVDHDVLIGVERADQAGRLDPIEIGSFMALSGVTGGHLVVKDTVPEDLRMIRLVFQRLGLHSAERDRSIPTMRR